MKKSTYTVTERNYLECIVQIIEGSLRRCPEVFKGKTLDDIINDDKYISEINGDSRMDNLDAVDAIAEFFNSDRLTFLREIPNWAYFVFLTEFANKSDDVSTLTKLSLEDELRCSDEDFREQEIIEKQFGGSTLEYIYAGGRPAFRDKISPGWKEEMEGESNDNRRWIE